MTGQACFINLQKAFDTQDHSILLKKLYAYGYRGPIFEILMDYLANRYQYIETVNDRTDKLQIKTGVPQGSILGPFLFLVYINDLPSYIGNSSRIAMFADDNSIVKAGPRNQCFLQTDLDRINNWFCYNKLSLNISKCEVVNFGIGIPNDLITTFNNEKLPKRNSCKYSGVYLDKKLLFHDLIEHIVKKLNKFSGMIYKVSDIYPIKCSLMFFKSFAKSIISYEILTYGSAAKNNLYIFEKAQRRILRAIFFRNKYDSVGYIFERNKISTVFEMYLMELFAEVFKQLRTESPFSSLNKAGNHSYYTRRNTKGLLSIPYSRTVTESKSVEKRLRQAYNWLKDRDLIPKEIRRLSNSQISPQLKKFQNFIS